MRNYVDSVVIWLNGTFGAGKTTTATELRPLLNGFRIFDPETVGYMLRANLTDLPVPDFQQWSSWRPLVVATAIEMMKQTGQNLIAPQTVLDEPYMTEIVRGFRSHGTTVIHVLLDADIDTLRSRITGSAEAREWRLAHLTTYAAARRWMLDAADLVLDTTTATPQQVALSIASAMAGLPE